MHQILELYSREKIQDRVVEIAAQITRDFRDQELIVVSILKGSFIFTADLVRQIQLPVSIDFLGLSSYGNSTQSSGVVKITRDLSSNITDKNVLVVEDIIDTGLTIQYLTTFLKTRNPKSVKVCTLLEKPSNNKAEIKIDYSGFRITNQFVVGYGLDWAERYRNLPYIGVVKESNE